MKTMFLAAGLCALLLVMGCLAPATTPTPPVIVTFQSSPSSVAAGQPVTLLWNVTSATSVRIDPGIGSVPAAGTQVVSPAATITYVLTASNSAGTVAQPLVITVTGQPTQPVVANFAISPSVITAGQPATLTWRVTGASSVSIDHGVGIVPASGSRVVYPNVTTVYTLTASGIASSVIATASVNVQQSTSNPVGDPVIDFTARYLGGLSWQLDWHVVNATRIVIEPDIGQVQPTGSKTVTVPPGQSRMYRLTATNSWGWAYWQVVVASP